MDLALQADQDMKRMNDPVFSRRKVRSGQTLYREGDSFHFMYAVRAGTFKSSVSLRDGREQVTHFHMAGDVVGLDGVANGMHASTATALEDADVCVIPFAGLLDPAAAGMSEIISRLMSQELVQEHGVMILLGSMGTEERVAAFLLDLSLRLKARGYSASEFHLRMSRAEIGSYLGLALETVSRALSAFQKQGLLDVDKKHVRIVDMDGLVRAGERQDTDLIRTLRTSHAA